jgi:poly-beta-hydroxyalkanoate depolymerase
MIIKLDQHSIILEKSWMKKHEMNYHEHDDSISFYLDHCNHLNASDRFYLNQSTKKKVFFSKKTYLINQKSSRTKK